MKTILIEDGLDENPGDVEIQITDIDTELFERLFENLSISCTLLSTPSIAKVMFIDVTFYSCCDLITLIHDCDWFSSSLKL